MKLFLDTSVLLAAAGSASGSSRAVFDYAAGENWSLLSSPYAVVRYRAILRSCHRKPQRIGYACSPKLTIVGDVVSLGRPALFPVGKDRPILFSALAWADTLLTLDKVDFADVLGWTFYGLQITLAIRFPSAGTCGRTAPPGPVT